MYHPQNNGLRIRPAPNVRLLCDLLIAFLETCTTARVYPKHPSPGICFTTSVSIFDRDLSFSVVLLRHRSETKWSLEILTQHLPARPEQYALLARTQVDKYRREPHARRSRDHDRKGSELKDVAPCEVELGRESTVSSFRMILTQKIAFWCE